jgi:hypothetical protein
MVFVPAGVLLGIAAREAATQKMDAWVALTAGAFLPPVLLDLLLASVRRGLVLPGQSGLSLLLMFDGEGPQIYADHLPAPVGTLPGPVMR